MGMVVRRRAIQPLESQSIDGRGADSGVSRHVCQIRLRRAISAFHEKHNHRILLGSRAWSGRSVLMVAPAVGAIGSNRCG